MHTFSAHIIISVIFYDQTIGVATYVATRHKWVKPPLDIKNPKRGFNF